MAVTKKITVFTDQYVPLEFELATISQRLLALLIDVTILGIYLIIMSLITVYAFLGASVYDANSYTLWFVIYILIVYLPFFLYTPIMEYLTGGQTIGKLAMGIQVISSNGDRITFQKAFLRWLFRPVEFYLLAFGNAAVLLIFFVGLFDLLVTVISRDNQRIGDFMSDTKVIKKRSAMKYILSDVLKIDTKSSHEVRYPEAISFTDEDMLLVKKIILEFDQNPTNTQLIELARELAEKAKNSMNIIATDQKDLPFLRQLLKDYVVLTR
jgi:uncharacterized RDD family membrane protein YckC